MLLVLAGLWGLGANPSLGQVSAEQVRRSLLSGVDYLRRNLPAPSGYNSQYPGGATALSLLALINAGVSPDDPKIQSGLNFLSTIPNAKTYVVSLRCQALSAYLLSEPRNPRPGALRELQQAADFLIRAQLDNGMWSYEERGGSGDNSNTQFALLGLHEAEKLGVEIPEETWNRALRHYRTSQTRDGGWDYNVGNSEAYGSMTAAGLASLFIVGEQLHVSHQKLFRDGQYPYCGQYRQNASIVRALKWITRYFSVSENPGKKSLWLYYYLYSLERVGMISGQQKFGGHDWYRQGAAFLVSQQRPDGSWGDTIDTAFAVLFLAKGNRPVLIQKLQWNGLWNRNIHDLEHLVSFIDNKLGKKVTWQSVSLSDPLEELRRAPILFITGHEFPEFNPEQKNKLKQFVESGGTLVGEACCGRKAFADGFRQFLTEVFPEYPLRPLSLDHPVFHSYYPMDDPYGLEGMNVGCRTSVFLSTKALSCLWELKTVPKFSPQAFQLGTNLAAYATGREPLPDKLEVVRLPKPDTRPAAESSAEAPRNALRFARLIHDGDYNSKPHALIHLAEMLRDQAGMSFVTRDRHLRADDEALFEYPVVFMHGHYSFELSPGELDGLRRYLRHGGVLIADSCCGQKAFDASFREMAAQLFPENPLTLLPGNHPIYTGQIGTPLGELRYRKILADELNSRGTTRPPIEAVTLDGRTVILYSRYDFGAGLEGDNPYSSRGYVDEDALKLAMNLFLYAIGF